MVGLISECLPQLSGPAIESGPGIHSLSLWAYMLTWLKSLTRLNKSVPACKFGLKIMVHSINNVFALCTLHFHVVQFLQPKRFENNPSKSKVEPFTNFPLFASKLQHQFTWGGSLFWKSIVSWALWYHLPNTDPFLCVCQEYHDINRILAPCNYCHHPWCVGHTSYHKAL